MPAPRRPSRLPKRVQRPSPTCAGPRTASAAQQMARETLRSTIPPGPKPISANNSAIASLQRLVRRHGPSAIGHGGLGQGAGNPRAGNAVRKPGLDLARPIQICRGRSVEGSKRRASGNDKSRALVVVEPPTCGYSLFTQSAVLIALARLLLAVGLLLACAVDSSADRCVALRKLKRWLAAPGRDSIWEKRTSRVASRCSTKETQNCLTGEI